MTGCRKFSDGSARDLLWHDSVGHMAAVGKGARKIMTETPDQLASVFTWTVFAGACVLVTLAATCLVLVYESPRDRDAAAAAAAAGPLDALELCPLGRAQRHRRHTPPGLWSRLDIGAGDVHVVVFAQRDGHVPWSHACSLESALKAAGNGSRVNAFVVHGTGGLGRDVGPSPVSLSALTEEYERDQLNVVHVHAAECLEHTPFRGADPADMSPELTAVAVQLAVLWQFGGTALDAGAVVVRGRVGRAPGATVAYGRRSVSSPVACHAFVYDMMLRARDLWTADRSYRPTAESLADGTAVTRTPRVAVDPLGCGGRDCRYEWCPADRGASDAAADVRNACPAATASAHRRRGRRRRGLDAVGQLPRD